MGHAGAPGFFARLLLLCLLLAAWLAPDLGGARALAQEAGAPAGAGDLPVSLEPAMGQQAGASIPGAASDTATPPTSEKAAASQTAEPAPVPPPDEAVAPGAAVAEDKPAIAAGETTGGSPISAVEGSAGSRPSRASATPASRPSRPPPTPTASDGAGDKSASGTHARNVAASGMGETASFIGARRGAESAAPPAIVDVLPHFLAAGLIVGVLAALLMLLMAMFARAPSLRLVAAFVFTLGALTFTLAYTGVTPLIWPKAQNFLLPLATFAEALMLFGAGLWLMAWLGTPQRRWARLVLMMLAGLVLALVLLAPFYPVTLLGVVRIAFFAIVLGGLSALLWPGMEQRRNGFALLALAGLFSWSMFGVLLTLQTFTITSPQAVLSISALLAALALLVDLASMTPEETQDESPQDAALALAGADALPFRYEPATARLKVPRQLAEELHLPPEVLDDIHGFLAIVHPEDRPVLEAALRTAALDEPAALGLRLADARGVWRRFTLRARAMREGPDTPRAIVGVLLETDDHVVPQVALEGADNAMQAAAESLHDPLTGLPGPALLLDRLETALSRARRGEGMPCLIIADVDRFRAIIDALGIAAGDALIAAVAQRLGALLHEGETLARLSGDQFALVVDAERHGTPLSFVHEIRRAMAEPFDVDGQELTVSLTIGVVDLVAAMTLSPRELVRAAEIALFEARREGPGREAFFTPDMHGEHARLARLEQELRRALKMGELEVHYQPIIWLGSRWLAGFEALVRWRHPERGLIGPEEFIGLAEDIGLVRDIGYLVLKETIRQLAIWQRTFRTEHPFYVAVNVASTDLLDPSLADDVAQLLAQENANPAGLRLEVTESLLLRDPAGARATLQHLAEMGVGVVCDDFGTGYSSLSRLRSLPFQALKIDRSFLSSDDPASRSVIAAIVGLAHGLSMHVVAEGVEEHWQLRLLEELACDMAQGYLIAPALDAATILHFMTEARRIAPFTGRLAALSHILLNEEVAPPLPEDVGKPQLPPKRPQSAPARAQAAKLAPATAAEASENTAESPGGGAPEPAEKAASETEAEAPAAASEERVTEAGRRELSEKEETGEPEREPEPEAEELAAETPEQVTETGERASTKKKSTRDPDKDESSAANAAGAEEEENSGRTAAE